MSKELSKVELAFRIEKRFLRKLDKLVIRLKGTKIRFVVKYMYGNRYSLERVRGKTKTTLELVATSKRVAELILREKDKSEEDKSLFKKLKNNLK